MKIKILSLICFFYAQSVFAGGWAGGGGIIARHHQNPWFLENTKVVKYCITANTQEFEVSYSTLSRLVEKSIDDWKAAFALIESSPQQDENGNYYDTFSVGTQEFIEGKCDEETDLNFTFGSLTDKQREYFENPKEYVGAAIRTEYDLENLKGKGFVYIAPTQGELKPLLPAINSETWTMFDNSWLQIVLWHELGHVFGVPHIEGTVMGENIAEIMQTQNSESTEENDMFAAAILKWVMTNYMPQQLLSGNRTTREVGCGKTSPVADHAFFGIEGREDSCILANIDDKGVFTLKFVGKSGSEVIAEGQVKPLQTTYTPLRVILPDTQKVYTNLAPSAVRTKVMDGEERVEYNTLMGSLKVNLTGKEHPLIITPNSLFSKSVLYDGPNIVRPLRL